MKRALAENISKVVDNNDLLKMFQNAKHNVKDWRERSELNRNFTKGYIWNVFTKDFSCEQKYYSLTIINMIVEFGEHLPNEILERFVVYDNKPPLHEEPNFDNI